MRSDIANSTEIPGPTSFRTKSLNTFHKFAPISVKAIRLYITRSSDTGKRQGSGDKVEAAEVRRKTSLRAIEVFAVKKLQPLSSCNL